mmetsp:Transcript_26420/g.63754  ORF Transcript_26420/g.63754 Transcript_26420/m.63754 type:complete len:218 (+) Transcript_26420:3563-4216(+)
MLAVSVAWTLFFPVVMASLVSSRYRERSFVRGVSPATFMRSTIAFVDSPALSRAESTMVTSRRVQVGPSTRKWRRQFPSRSAISQIGVPSSPSSRLSNVIDIDRMMRLRLPWRLGCACACACAAESPRWWRPEPGVGGLKAGPKRLLVVGWRGSGLPLPPPPPPPSAPGDWRRSASRLCSFRRRVPMCRRKCIIGRWLALAAARIGVSALSPPGSEQ